MAAIAEIICYVQPVKAQAVGVAWVDTSKTASIRKMVSTKAEAASVVAEARELAVALGGGMAIKTIARSISGFRRPSGVRALEGSQVVA